MRSSLSSYPSLPPAARTALPAVCSLVPFLPLLLYPHYVYCIYSPLPLYPHSTVAGFVIFRALQSESHKWWSATPRLVVLIVAAFALLICVVVRSITHQPLCLVGISHMQCAGRWCTVAPPGSALLPHLSRTSPLYILCTTRHFLPAALHLRLDHASRQRTGIFALQSAASKASK